jgi:hypothetical protein
MTEGDSGAPSGGSKHQLHYSDLGLHSAQMGRRVNRSTCSEGRAHLTQQTEREATTLTPHARTHGQPVTQAM